MNLSIRAGGMAFSIKLEEEECQSRFSAIVEQILNFKREEANAEPFRRASLSAPSAAPSAASALPPVLYSAKGFLVIKCSHCGKTKAFCNKSETTSYFCNHCGGKTDYDEELIRVYAKCKCGGSFAYKTNLHDPIFEINCVQCGAPISVEYNVKRGEYHTIE